MRRIALLFAALLFAAAASAQNFPFPGGMSDHTGGGGGGGTPPDVGATSSGTAVGGAGATSGTVNLPASIAAGNDLFAAMSFSVGTVSGVTLGSISSPDEYAETSASGTSMLTTQAFKVASGSEGASAAAAWTTTSRFAAAAIKVTGTSDSTLVCGTPVAATNTNPNPPAVAFTAPALIVTYLAVDSDATTISADPSGYATGCVGDTTGATGGTQVRICTCRATVGTDCSSGDPGTWTLSVSTNNVAQTCAIEDN